MTSFDVDVTSLSQLYDLKQYLGTLKPIFLHKKVFRTFFTVSVYFESSVPV